MSRPESESDQPPAPSAPTAGRFCTSCGHTASGGRFCSACGAALDAAPAVPTVPQQADPSDAPTAVMATRDGLDALDWQDVPEEPVPDAAVAEAEPAEEDALRPRRRTALVVAGTVAGLLALGAGGVAGAQYYADADVREALATSGRAFDGTVTAFSAADDVDQVAGAAQEADAAAEQVDRALDRLGRVSGPEDSSVRAQLESEKAVLEALGRLDGMASEPLASWGAAHTALTSSTAAEGSTRDRLATFHDEAARELPDTGLMLRKVTAAVGPALVEDATSESARMLTTLRNAEDTGDLRTLGDAAGSEQDAVAAAAAALPDGDGKTVLSGYASALSALGDLATVSGESAAGWTATRADLARTFGQVAASAGSTGGAQVRVVLDGALTSADDVVSTAVAAFRDWRAKTDAAVKARTSDGEALTSYASFFRSQGKTYEQLREDLSTFTARVEDPGVYYYEAYAAMSQAEQDRRDVRDLLVGADVPQGMQTAHQGVVSAIDRAIEAVRSAYDGLSQSQDCFEGCPYYQDTPGWQRFQSESEGISKAYAAAMGRWEAAVAATKTAIANRPLPAKPEV